MPATHRRIDGRFTVIEADGMTAALVETRLLADALYTVRDEGGLPTDRVTEYVLNDLNPLEFETGDYWNDDPDDLVAALIAIADDDPA